MTTCTFGWFSNMQYVIVYLVVQFVAIGVTFSNMNTCYSRSERCNPVKLWVTIQRLTIPKTY